nr:hypothetical protein Ade03nite_21560 [Actinoplanes derwentensis]
MAAADEPVTVVPVLVVAVSSPLPQAPSAAIVANATPAMLKRAVFMFFSPGSEHQRPTLDDPVDLSLAGDDPQTRQTR